MARPLWGGRFRERPHPMLQAFSESLSVDRALAEVDLRASLAHAQMLRAQKLITAKELGALRKGLRAIERDLRADRLRLRPEDEDIHMAVEAELTRRVGEPARKLHTARSRNDQVATDLRLWSREAADRLMSAVRALQAAFVAAARAHQDLVIPGYTHLQRAQPVLLAHHLLAYVEMLDRDHGRLADCRKRLNRSPLGAGALAGTTLSIDRAATAEALGFDRPCANSMDAVADRDFCVELAAAAAVLCMHLSRFAEDAILWASQEWGLLRLPDAWSTGSSLMPQKRNPDLLELVRGKTGRVYGDLTALLTLLKGLALAYNRDLQEDKPPLFDAVRTALACLEVLTAFLPDARFDREAAQRLLQAGHLEATALAEHLVARGMPFRSAHEAVGKLVREAEARGCALADLPLETLRSADPGLDEDVRALLTPTAIVDAYRSAGSSARQQVGRALRRWARRLERGRKPRSRS